MGHIINKRGNIAFVIPTPWISSLMILWFSWMSGQSVVKDISGCYEEEATA